jgi:hypothetical protein
VLDEMLPIALCSVLSGGDTCSDMALFGWLKRSFLEEFLTLKRGIPRISRSVTIIGRDCS